MFTDLFSNISCGSARYSANLQSTTDLEGRLPANLAWWYPYFHPTTSPLLSLLLLLLLHAYLSHPSSLSPSLISNALRQCLSGPILAHCRCPVSRDTSSATPHFATNLLRLQNPSNSIIMNSFIDYSKNTRSKNYHGSGSFATFMIIARKWTVRGQFIALALISISSCVLLSGHPFCLIPLRFPSSMD
jgi:hypothetical protein